MTQDNTTPDRVIKLPVRSGYCTDCPHKAFEHEIGMNTPQSGRCLVAGCGCFSLSSPGRDALGDEIERLLVAVTQQAEEIERLRELLTAWMAWFGGPRAEAVSYIDPPLKRTIKALRGDTNGK